MLETRSVVMRVGDGLAVTFERARLLVQEGPDEGIEYRLHDRPAVIGRGEEADLRVADSTVSRAHAVVQPGEQGWKIRDLESKSGTCVNGTPVEVAPLVDGSRIQLGQTEIEFRVGKTELRTSPSEGKVFEGLLGHSQAIRRTFGLIEKVAALDLPVLLIGESGTGKESLARAVHRFGPSPDGPYEVVDCTLLEREHLRSELFGHVKGAFTGADSDRTGALERAHGGSVLFDEVAELPLELQPQLLRVLQEGEVRPLGSNKTRRVRARVVGATNRNLEAEVAAGRFRADLFYRLSAITVEVPPLRARDDDCLLLAEHFMGDGFRLAEDARVRIRAHSWPGNVRELENVVRRAAALAEEGLVRGPDLGPLSSGTLGGAAPDPDARDGVGPSTTTGTLTPPTLDTAIADQEARVIQEAIDRAGGNRKLAAERLGISRATLYRKLKKLGME